MIKTGKNDKKVKIVKTVSRAYSFEYAKIFKL